MAKGKKPSICGWHGKLICEKCHHYVDYGVYICKCKETKEKVNEMDK